MLRPSYDVILQLGGEEIELLGKSRYPYRQIAVALGMLLGIQQGLGIRDVELHVGESLAGGRYENVGDGIQILIREQLGISLYDSRRGACGAVGETE